jgi:hypothetical protein
MPTLPDFLQNPLTLTTVRFVLNARGGLSNRNLVERLWARLKEWRAVATINAWRTSRPKFSIGSTPSVTAS